MLKVMYCRMMNVEWIRMRCSYGVCDGMFHPAAAPLGRKTGHADPCRPADFLMPIPRPSRCGRAKEKGLPKKAFQINSLFWLPDLGSNQGHAD